MNSVSFNTLPCLSDDFPNNSDDRLESIEISSDIDSGRGSSIDFLEDYKIGDILWAQYKKFNWWPCIVVPEPSTNQIYLS